MRQHIIPYRLFESKRTPIQRDRFDLIVNNKVATWIDRLLSKCFYESRDQRHTEWEMAKCQQLKPETKAYLLEIYQILEAEGLLYPTAFLDATGRLPQTPEEKIQMLSGNHWGGHGRRAKADSQISQLPIPTPAVIRDLMSTLEPHEQEELQELYRKLFTTQG